MSTRKPAMPDLAVTLLDCKQRDQEARKQAQGPDADPFKLGVVVTDNTFVLREIVEKHGWPGHSLVGELATNAAWWIAQHADHDRDFQQQVLFALRQAVSEGEATPAQLAHLTDRCLLHAGMPQLYGTQYSYQGGTLTCHEIEDPENLDARRAELGLEPWAEFDEVIRTAFPVVGAEVIPDGLP